MRSTILQLSNDEARRYFLRASRYCTIPLPGYFDFQPVLDALNREIGAQKLMDISKLGQKVDDDEYANYTFLTNKDGNFAWRPLIIINPAVYVCLVNRITETAHWKLIQKRFKQFQKNKRVICYSIPLVTEERENQLKEDTSVTINNWWEYIEQQSIELALQYSTVLVTDITDCYSSIYTHSIGWALHGKKKARDARQNQNPTLTGCIIDKMIQQMSYRQTNGIPQGSVLMDFIAEMVLGYADMELTKKNEISGIDFQVLRYRDDYRIFAHSEVDAVMVAKVLSEVLSDLNLKLNSQKTYVSNKVIRDVIKPDKLYWNEAKHGEKTLQKHLLLIHSLADKYPNSGTLATAMAKFMERIYPMRTLQEANSKVLISIIVDIAYNNPRVYSLAIVCIGKILSIEPDRSKVDEILLWIDEKFKKKTNIGYWLVWSQRLTIKYDRSKELGSKEKLCQIAAGNNAVQLWGVKWLQVKYQRIITRYKVFNDRKFDAMENIPQPQEVKIFTY